MMSCEKINLVIDMFKAVNIQANFEQADLWFYHFNCLILS